MDENVNEETAWHPSHPAELAAYYTNDDDVGSETSNQHILRVLRKNVFSVPLMQQDEVADRFTEIDRRLSNSFLLTLYASQKHFIHILNTVVKIAAGNTYGKNIYNKKDLTIEGLKPTYKGHEVAFLQCAYTLLYYANTDIYHLRDALDKCDFIRGVKEEVLDDFNKVAPMYREHHWAAARAKLEGNTEEYNYHAIEISRIDKHLKLSVYAFGISKLAEDDYKFFLDQRARIISPYLRSVYRTARNTAKNVAQMLDNFQNGAIGLVRAISCYNVERPTSFSSVAKWWIKQTMLLSIKEDANFVKLPVSTWQTYTQLERIRNQLGGEEDIKQIARISTLSETKVKAVYDAIKVSQVYSLNKTYDNEDKFSLADIVSISDDEDPITSQLRAYCDIAALTATETKILALKHGMLDILDHTHIDIKEVQAEAFRQNLALNGYNFVMK